ncbi:hypothetical protein D3C85_538510 [compost metagenome]
MLFDGTLHMLQDWRSTAARDRLAQRVIGLQVFREAITQTLLSRNYQTSTTYRCFGLGTRGSDDTHQSCFVHVILHGLQDTFIDLRKR